MNRNDLPPPSVAAGHTPSEVRDSATRAASMQEVDRPWPMVLLLGLGGWLAALPLLAALGLLLEKVYRDNAALLCLIGLGMIAAATATLRLLHGRVLPEQSAFPTLLAGGGMLGWGLFLALPDALAAPLLALAAAAVAGLLPQRWLKTVLGAAAAGVLPLAIDSRSMQHAAWWAILHANIALWAAASLALRQRDAAPGVHGGAPQAIDAWFDGWLACTLAQLCAWSGTSFMAGSLPLLQLVADSANAAAAHGSAGMAAALCAASVGLAATAAMWLVQTLPSLRQPWCAGVALTLLVFTWFMPALGGALLVIAGCIARQRYRLAIAAALAAAWVVGSAYYQLSWSLNQKAIVFGLTGFFIIAFAWRALAAPQPEVAPLAQPAALQPVPMRRAGAGIALCLLAVLAAANVSVWRNEELMANSETVFVELAPVDPRSLLQGDYMRLAVHAPPGLGPNSTIAIGVRDEHNIVRLQRADDGRPLAPDELRVVLTWKDGRWILASDAWFFQEGEAKRYEKARYGEYHVGKDGRTLLTGLRGPALEKL